MNDHIPSGLGAVDRVDSGAGSESVHSTSRSDSASTARKFRKKPVVVEAVQYTEAMRDACVFDDAPLPPGVFMPSKTYNRRDRTVWRAEAYIDTMEGRMEVSLGDWVITGIKGEHYACKPDIFALTYEPVEDAAATGGKTA